MGGPGGMNPITPKNNPTGLGAGGLSTANVGGGMMGKLGTFLHNQVKKEINKEYKRGNTNVTSAIASSRLGGNS